MNINIKEQGTEINKKSDKFLNLVYDDICLRGHHKRTEI